MEGLLDEGRQLCTDNWYSSVPLVRKLLKRKTHLIGTLRRNRKGIPTQLKDRKLKRGQMYYQQSRSGILVLKWKDKRDLLMISTKHDASLTQNNKPKVVEDYNNMMGYVDQSDQMAAYTPFVRKTTRWYLRIFFHLITQAAIVNAWRLYSNIMEKIRLTDFKLILIESLLQEEPQPSQTSDHKLEQLAGPKAAALDPVDVLPDESRAFAKEESLPQCPLYRSSGCQAIKHLHNVENA
ncbi:hypothetical protein ANCDUO_25397 [Ancylostoma duodenale]|uniref:PiggyBac transposable element-derived protein domain-containing protein n=1 Tax=Ancylostoma duodenale TaxID=51022 RepID=A0A0C2C4I8_9BILA|nr:hypothetical protein ANCDUO_25397 [Ancylostoma duodenale]